MRRNTFCLSITSGHLKHIAILLIIILVTGSCATSKPKVVESDSFKAFVSAYNSIRRYYYTRIEGQTLVEEAMQGMLDVSGLELSQTGLPASLFSLEENAGPGKRESIPFSSIRAFSQLFARIKKQKPSVNENTLFEGAIRGMVSHLDSSSEFLDEEASKYMLGHSRGAGGVGVVISVRNGKVVIINLVKNGPAWKAGIENGDSISVINGQPAAKLSLIRIIKELRGDIGTKLYLTVTRQNGIIKRYTLIRQHVRLKDVSARLMSNGIGYVQLIALGKNTSKRLVRKLYALERKNHAPLKGLILDLRNNMGGLLKEAIATANIFIEKGVLLEIQGRSARGIKQYTASPQFNHKWESIPLVVLINGSVASSGEIISSAMQDSHRATLVGSKTFGWGKIQTVIPLPGKVMLKLTTYIYKRASGKIIHGHGVTPDICIKGNKIYRGRRRSTGNCEQQARYYDFFGDDVELNYAVKMLKEKTGIRDRKNKRPSPRNPRLLSISLPLKLPKHLPGVKDRSIDTDPLHHRAILRFDFDDTTGAASDATGHKFL